MKSKKVDEATATALQQCCSRVFTVPRSRCNKHPRLSPGCGLVCKSTLVARLRSLLLSQRRLQQQTVSALHSVSELVSKDNTASHVYLQGSVQNK